MNVRGGGGGGVNNSFLEHNSITARTYFNDTVDSRYLEIEGTLKKQFEISVLRHIRFVVLRKKQSEQPNFTNDYVI